MTNSGEKAKTVCPYCGVGCGLEVSDIDLMNGIAYLWVQWDFNLLKVGSAYVVFTVGIVVIVWGSLLKLGVILFKIG